MSCRVELRGSRVIRVTWQDSSPRLTGVLRWPRPTSSCLRINRHCGTAQFSRDFKLRSNSELSRGHQSTTVWDRPRRVLVDNPCLTYLTPTFNARGLTSIHHWQRDTSLYVAFSALRFAFRTTYTITFLMMLYERLSKELTSSLLLNPAEAHPATTSRHTLCCSN